MASRNERRRRAKQKRESLERSERHANNGAMVTPLGHGDRALLSVARSVKTRAQKAAELESKQVQQQDSGDGIIDVYGYDKVVKPPLPLDRLWELKEVNAIHSGCIDAKVADAVGRGWRLEAADDEDEHPDDAKRLAGDVTAWLRDITKPARRQFGMSFSAMCRQVLAEKDATGQGYWEVARNPDGTIGAIFPVPPHTVAHVKDSPDVYVVQRGRSKVYFKKFGAEGDYNSETGEKGGDGDSKANELLCFKHYSPRSPWYGIPGWVSAIPPVAEFSAIREYNISWHESGGTTDRLIHTKANDAGVAKTLADSIVDQLSDSEGVGHTTIVSSGSEDTEVEVEMLTATEGKRDGQFGERRHDIAQEILVAHQVPAYRVGWAIQGQLNGDAAEEMDDSYKFGVVEPLQEDFEEDLAGSLFDPEQGGFDLQGYAFKFRDMDEDESESIAEVNSAVESGLLTPNDGRERLGEERKDDPALDVHYRQGQPLGQRADQPSAADVVDTLEKALRAVLVEKESEHPAADDDAPAETRKRLVRFRRRTPKTSETASTFE